LVVELIEESQGYIKKVAKKIKKEKGNGSVIIIANKTPEGFAQSLK